MLRTLPPGPPTRAETRHRLRERFLRLPEYPPLVTWHLSAVVRHDDARRIVSVADALFLLPS